MEQKTPKAATSTASLVSADGKEKDKAKKEENEKEKAKREESEKEKAKRTAEEEQERYD